jgi:flagellar protein FliS
VHITNPYQRYAETNLLSASPLQLVVMLYEFALENVNAACALNLANDPAGRGRAVNNAFDALFELSASCNPDVSLTGELRDLYGYMQRRLTEAHIEQSETKLQEVAGLLKTMLEAWRQISASTENDAYRAAPEMPAAVVAAPVPPGVSAMYGRF